MAAESNLPDFTTLPTDKHVGTVQEVVHNPEHNLYQVTEYSLVFIIYIFYVAHICR
jgi:hypothetical protein